MNKTFVSACFSFASLVGAIARKRRKEAVVDPRAPVHRSFALSPVVIHPFARATFRPLKTSPCCRVCVHLRLVLRHCRVLPRWRFEYIKCKTSFHSVYICSVFFDDGEVINLMFQHAQAFVLSSGESQRAPSGVIRFLDLVALKLDELLDNDDVGLTNSK